MTPAPDRTLPPGGILNQEEISFLLRPDRNDGLLKLVSARCAADPGFNQTLRRIARQYAEALQKLLRCPIQARITILPTPKTVCPSDLVFAAAAGHVSCRLTAADAAALTGGALGVSAGGSCSPSRGISLNILRRCLQPLSREIDRAFPGLDDKTQNVSLLAANPHADSNPALALLLQLDIRNRAIKLNLTFGLRILMKHWNGKIVPDHKSRPCSASLNRGISAARVCLTAQTAAVSQPLSQVTHWQKGTFVPLAMKPGDPIRLAAPGLPEFKAVIGRKGTRIAVKLNNKGNDK